MQPSSPRLFLHRECAGKFLGAVEGVHAEGGAVAPSAENRAERDGQECR